MPSLSPTMEQGNLGKWSKSVGDRLMPGEVLVEVETDKAQMDFEYNEDEGYIAAILLKEGSKDVKVGSPLLILSHKSEDIEEVARRANEIIGLTSSSKESNNLLNKQQTLQEEEEDKNTTIISNSTARPTPAALFFAKQNEIPLNMIKEISGPGGRMILADVIKFNNTKNINIINKQVKNNMPDIDSSTKFNNNISSSIGSFITYPLTNMRKVISARLTDSKSTIPHYYLTGDISMDRVAKLREVLNSKNIDIKLSFNDFVVRASALALQRVPQVNSAWDGNGGIRVYRDSDICVAVATDGGLITPIVKQAQNCGLADISKKIKDFAQRAKNNSLKPEEYQGGSFTISNLGMFGSVNHFTAIINPPQAAILAIGSIQEKVVRGEEEGQFEINKVMNVTLSCDHRVVDGAVGAEWLREFKKFMEEPLNMLL